MAMEEDTAESALKTTQPTKQIMYTARRPICLEAYDQYSGSIAELIVGRAIDKFATVGEVESLSGSSGRAASPKVNT